MPKLLSVIVPMYNSEKTISKCLDSILNQNFSDYEIIIIDDGSNDDSFEICKEYEETNENVILYKMDNSGVVAARKQGLYLSSGKYIIYIDSDDFVDNGYFFEINNIISNYNPEVIMFSHYNFAKNKSKVTYPYESKFYSKNEFMLSFRSILYSNLRGQSISPALWDKVILRDLLLKYYPLVDNSIIMGDDRAITRPVLYNCDSFYYSDKAFYNYVYNPNSLTKSKKVYSMITPKLIATSFISVIDPEDIYLRERCLSSTTSSLFNAVVSQFNRNDSFKKIKSDIKLILDDDFYKECIYNTKCRLLNFKMLIAKYTLKFKMYHTLKLINLLR